MKGFTFIEVLVAMLIFTLAALASITIVNGSVRATKESKEISQATWLLQKLMADTESKMESLGIDKACQEKSEGKFDAPYDKFHWKTACYQIDFQLSQSLAKLQEQLQQGKKSDDGDNQESLFLKMILDTASEYLTRSTRELHVEVHWTHGKAPRQIALTTHFVRFDQQPAIPGMPGMPGAAGATGAGASGATGAGTPTGTAGAPGTTPNPTGGN